MLTFVRFRISLGINFAYLKKRFAYLKKKRINLEGAKCGSEPRGVVAGKVDR